MSTGLAHRNFDKGGMCYVACAEAFQFYNASIHWCRKGCDFSVGRVNDEILRKEAELMCKKMAASCYAFRKGEDLDEIQDLRIHPNMFPVNAQNVYKACLAGIRRQRY